MFIFVCFVPALPSFLPYIPIHISVEKFDFIELSAYHDSCTSQDSDKAKFEKCSMPDKSIGLNVGQIPLYIVESLPHRRF